MEIDKRLRRVMTTVGIAFCAGVILHLLDKVLFGYHGISFAYGHASLWERCVSSYFRFELLQLVLALVAGYILYHLFNFRIASVFLTWFFWSIAMYLSFTRGFQAILWFLDIPFQETAIWQASTLIPFILGPLLIPRWSSLQKVLSLRQSRVSVVGLGIVSMGLTGMPIVLYMNSQEYKTVHAMQIPIPQQAKGVRKTWNPHGGIWIVQYDLETGTPEGLLHFYDSNFNKWRVGPRSHGDWVDVSTNRKLKGIDARWFNDVYHVEVALMAFPVAVESSRVYNVMINAFPDSLTRQKYYRFL